MSWSIYTVAKPDQVEERVNALQPPGDSFPERDDQVKIAKQVAVEVVKSGAVGDGEAFQISFTGHANTDHKPAQGWANDTLAVTVTQVAASAVDTFDTNQAAAQRNLQ